MARSEVDICNSALLRLNAAPITTLSDDTDRARIVSQLYATVRDATLRAHPWNFAVNRMALAEITPAPAFGFAKQFQLPADCLRVLQMEDADMKFKIEGRKLLTDEDEGKIIYITQITDPVQYDSLFYNALSTRLAAEIAAAVTGRAELGTQQWQLYTGMIQETRTIDGQEGTIDDFQSDDLVDVR